MSSKRSEPQGDFNALARQYWDALSQMAGGSGQSSGGMPGIQQGMDWWSKLLPRGNQQLDDTIERMNSQAGSWFGAMQKLSEQLAGSSAAPAEIASSWKSILSGGGANPVTEMFARMSAGDAQSFDAWANQTGPLLAMLKGETATTLGMPTFGLTREHQERAQQLSRAQLQYKERVNDYSAQLARAAKLAFERFETRLAERSEPGRQIDSARALFDLWIDAAEEAWAEVAISDEYRAVYGEYVNAQMQLRVALQREVEQVVGALGLPTRTEMNGSHRKLAALEREVRSLRRQLGERTRPASVPAGSGTMRPEPVASVRKGAASAAAVASKSGAKAKHTPAGKAKERPARASAPGKPARASSATAGSKKTALKKTASKKTASKKTASKKTATKSARKAPSRSRADASRTAVRTAPARSGMILPKVALPEAVASPARKNPPAAARGSSKRPSRKR